MGRYRSIHWLTGTGMYSPQGLMAGFYDEALADAGFQSYWGRDASAQALDMPDALVRETAVAIFRERLRTEKPVVVPWKETIDMRNARAAKVVPWMNAECDLQGLCHQWPQRLYELRDAEGDRLKY